MRFRIPVVLAMTVFAVGCLDKAEVDEAETAELLVTQPQIQDFDPSNSIIPFPNILLLSPTTGLNTLPATCGESVGAQGLRQGVLNTLDGVGTWLPAVYATFTAQVDLASTEGRVFLVKQVADPTEAEAVPAQIGRFQTVRYDEALPVCGAANVIEAITVTPVVPLDDDSVYTVAILQGVTSAAGEEFQPSTGWFFSRQLAAPVSIYDRDGNGVLTTSDVVFNNTPLDQFDPRDANGNGVADTIESLAGIQQLHGLNQAFLPFVDAALDTVTGEDITRDNILIAWAFKTQTVEEPLDPSAASPAAAAIAAAELAGPFGPIAPGGSAGSVQAFYEANLGAGICTQLPCAAIGAVYGGALSATNFQVAGPNTGVLTTPVPGPWSNPLNPTEQPGSPLQILAVRPATAAPAGGYPLVVFAHGITRSKGDLLAIAGQLAGLGIASVAIDWPLHGSRAVQIFPTGSACQDPSDPAVAPNPADPTRSAACFAPILSSNLPATRDAFRQGALDIMSLVAAMTSTCAAPAGATACNGFSINPNAVGYIGQSLGAIIGTVPVAMDPTIKAAVLNVGAVSLITILENTDTNRLKCPLIDALINNGTLQGKLWLQPNNTFNDVDALCVQTDTTKPISIVNEPAYRSFAVAARWVADPADGVNFLDVIGGRVAEGDLRVLVQQVKGDLLVPNEATAIIGRLLGFSAPTEAATPAGPPPFTASTGLGNPATAAAWVNYSSDVVTYGHGSLLQPAAATAQAQAATGQMQTDAFTFMATQLAAAAAAAQ